ncbi:gamma-glutamyltranspeptidase [Escherichia coli]|uniref:Gamma-glutamyltranspeptidase n=1 Tax=Escherichia coli TaxID=562 RepID=A0A376MK08_ECOLX|nr:gamma-glutamyltranspeptidase [Escherichia coli]
MLPNHENSKAIFWKEGAPLKKGDKLVQANLAKSLEMIAENGPARILQRHDSGTDCPGDAEKRWLDH